jgi:DNA helicase-2/ATP-dependent DNA helicase PcrA
MMSKSRILVSANPGSGKTEDLSNQVSKLLQDGVDSDNILCLTFTNKARDEMERRIIIKMKDTKYKVPDIHTFHSLSQSIINHRMEGGDLIPERFLRYQILKSLETRQIMNYDGEVLSKDYPAIVNVGQIVNAIKFLKSFAILPDKVHIEELKKNVRMEYNNGNGVNGYTLEEMEILCEGFLDIFRDYESSKNLSQMDYNDILLRAVNYSKAHFNKYQYVFVDEVQDMSEIEYELVKQVGENVYAVGDMKQAIFGFQGGNVRALRDMMSGKDFEKRVIDGTRRLPKNVVEYCINFYRTHEPEELSPELDHFRSMNEKDGVVTLIRLKDKGELIDAVTEILNKQNNDESVGIIVRTNEQANDLSDSLTLKNISHQKISGTKGEKLWREEISKFIGGIYGTSDSIIGMIYSIYSRIPLYDGIQIAERMRFENDLKKVLPRELIDIREKYGNHKNQLLQLFNDYIIPNSIALGESAFEAAKDVFDSLPMFLDRFGTGEEYSLASLQKYILQENSRDSVDEISEKVCIITVHKAKGLEFDHVIYIPKYTEKKNISAIDLIVDSILKSNNLSYSRDERIKEENRIDFVALTRTKNSLDIITEKKSSTRYDLEPCKKIDFTTKIVNNEFVSMKDISDREKLKLNFKPWIRDYLKKKMEKLNNLSFTMLERVKELDKFVESYVLGIQTKSSALTFGSDIHSYIENYIKSHETPPIMNDEKLTRTWSNFISYDKYVREIQKGKWLGSEMKFKQKVSNVFPDIMTNITVEGRIDGLYKYIEGNTEKTVIVDFKTSKKVNRDYVNQLSLYAKLFSLENKIDMEQIESEIAYLSLRDTKVNINRIEKRWDRIDPTIEMRALEDVKKTVEKFVNYKLSVDSMIRDILSVRNTESNVFIEFQKMLKMEMENS